MNKFPAGLGLLVAISVVLSACATPATTGDPSTAAGETIPAPTSESPSEPKYVSFNLGPGDVPTLDPSLSQDVNSTQVVEETSVGLTRQDEVTAANEPGMATSWDVVDNADGTETITFRIRTDIPWVRYNGQEVEQVRDCQDPGQVRFVKAQDFAYAILRTLAPDTASTYAYVLAFAVKGAADYNSGASADASTVGVRALDDATLEITFNEPAVYNLNIAGMWVAHAEPKWIIEGDDCTEARGERWTEPGFFQGYGPFVLKEWIHDSSMVIVKNPFWPGTDTIPQSKLDEVRFVMLDNQPALAEYETGNLDVTPVPLSDLDRVKADAQLSKELNIAPDLCTYYYEINSQAPGVDDVRVRLALSEAIDRQAIIDNVTKGGQEPAQWVSRPGLAGAPTITDYPDLGVKYDPEDAKAQLQSYLDEKGLTADQLDLTLLFNTSSAHQRIAEAVQQMWKDTLGVEVRLTNQEFKVYLDTVIGPDTPQIFRRGWCQDYPDASNFLRDVFAVGGHDNPNGAKSIGGVSWENPRFEELMVLAARETDVAKRVALYAEAEEILVKTDAVVIPIYWYTHVDVTKPFITRTHSVLGGFEHFEKWDVASR